MRKTTGTGFLWLLTGLGFEGERKIWLWNFLSRWPLQVHCGRKADGDLERETENLLLLGASSEFCFPWESNFGRGRMATSGRRTDNKIPSYFLEQIGTASPGPQSTPHYFLTRPHCPRGTVQSHLWSTELGSVASDPREGGFPVLPLTRDTVGCFAEPSPSEVLGDIFWHLQLPHSWCLWVDGKAGQRVCISADVSQRKTSSSTQNISLIRIAFARQLVSLSYNTGQLLRRFSYLSFCSEIAKASGRLWNRYPEFLPPFLLWRKDRGQCHFKGRCGEVAPAPVCLLLSISAGSQVHFLMWIPGHPSQFWWGQEPPWPTRDPSLQVPSQVSSPAVPIEQLPFWIQLVKFLMVFFIFILSFSLKGFFFSFLF